MRRPIDDTNAKTADFGKQFVSLFGCSSQIVSILCKRCYATLPVDTRPKHLLGALVFLKLYESEAVHASIVGATSKTFHIWSWAVVDAIQKLQIVSYFSNVPR